MTLKKAAVVEITKELQQDNFVFFFLRRLPHEAKALKYPCTHSVTMVQHHDPTPAIVRDFNEVDREVDVMFELKNTVTHTRGFGDSGYKLQVVEHDCAAEYCWFDRMVRRVDVNSELPMSVRYWCLNPNCVHYVSDSISYACHGSYPQRNVKEPAIFEERKVKT